MLNDLIRSLRLTVLTIGSCVVGYTALVLTAATTTAPNNRLGSLIYGADGKLVGSRLIAQAFTRPEYLWPRPSAVDYNAMGAGGSNLSPTNLKIRERAETLLANYSLSSGANLPADLVTASGSGLDPHITLEAALIQADRIAMSRHVDISVIQDLVKEHVESLSSKPFTQDSLVNVLEFNLLLDARLKKTGSQQQPERVSVRLSDDSTDRKPEANAYRLIMHDAVESL